MGGWVGGRVVRGKDMLLCELGKRFLFVELPRVPSQNDTAGPPIYWIPLCPARARAPLCPPPHPPMPPDRVQPPLASSRPGAAASRRAAARQRGPAGGPHPRGAAGGVQGTPHHQPPGAVGGGGRGAGGGLLQRWCRCKCCCCWGRSVCWSVKGIEATTWPACPCTHSCLVARRRAGMMRRTLAAAALSSSDPWSRKRRWWWSRAQGLWCCRRMTTAPCASTATSKTRRWRRQWRRPQRRQQCLVSACVGLLHDVLLCGAGWGEGPVCDWVWPGWPCLNPLMMLCGAGGAAGADGAKRRKARSESLGAERASKRARPALDEDVVDLCDAD